MSELVAALLAALDDDRRARFAAWSELEEAVARVVDDARTAWPTLRLEPSGFGAHLAARLRADLSPADALAALRVGDLAVAWAALANDPAALRAFDDVYLARLAPALRRLRLDDDLIQETLQELRRRLLVSDGRRAKLHEYAGHGDLLRWLRVVAVRDALELLGRRRKQPTSLPDELLAAIPDEGTDAELAYLRDEYGEHVRRAFAEALDELADDERALLRYHIVESMTIDQIALMLDMHRATVARQIERTRARVGTLTKKRLQRQLGLDPFELTSLLRVIDSQIDLSIARLLG
jgi:RNA polymerase sigma-70 factor, ECF subfamily